MSEVERTDIRIDGNTAIWELRMEGSISGTYAGTFRFKCYLTPMQQISAGREERELLGSNIALAPDHERFLAFALTQLKQRIISAPPFWASATSGFMQGDLPDEEVVAAILDAATNAELIYKKQLKKRKEEAIERSKKIAEQLNKNQELQDELAEIDKETDD